MKAVSTRTDMPSLANELKETAPMQGERTAAGTAGSERVGILVGGMHRSGTSAVTRLLNIIGCDMADDLVEGDQFNEKGYWESEEVYRLNDRILASAGLNWDSWEPLSDAWLDSPRYGEFRDLAISLIERQFAGSSLFVMKDPRLSRTLPVWLGAFEALGIKPSFVFMYRNPAEVAASLLKRNGLNSTIGQLVWLRYVLDAEYHSRGITRSLVFYPDLVADWRVATDSLSAKLDVVWPNMSPKAQMEATEFISPKLRHHDSGSNDTLSHIDYRAVPWVAETYATLSGRDNLDEESVQALLDKIRAGFSEATVNLFRVYKEFYDFSAHQMELAQKYSDSILTLQDEISARNEAMNKLGEEIQQKNNAMNKLGDDIHQKNDAIEKLSKAIDQKNEAISALSGQIDALNQDIEKKKKDEATALAVFSEFKRSYEHQLQEISELQKARADYEQRIGALNKKLRKIEKNIVWKLSYPLRKAGSALSRGYKKVLAVFGIR